MMSGINSMPDLRSDRRDLAFAVLGACIVSAANGESTLKKLGSLFSDSLLGIFRIETSKIQTITSNCENR